MTTPNKIEANRRNSRRSSGPITPAGKKYSSQNSLKHGLFARHVPLSDADKIEFDTLLSELVADYSPTTTLEHLAIEDIARCAWRSTVALRLEARLAETLLENSNTQTENGGPSAQPSAWYGLSLQELRAAKGWLKEVCLDFTENQRLREEWKPTFDFLFGAHFYQTLTQWQEMSLDNILMAEMLTSKAKTYGMTPAPGFDEFKHSAQGVIVDPRQQFEFKEKLLSNQLQHLEDLQRIWQQTSQIATPRAADFSPRFFTTAQRDLHRAVAWFWTLREKKAPTNE
jgi:hypothetical protein